MIEYSFKEVPNSSGKVIDTITITTNDYLSFPTFFITKHKLNNESAPAIRMFYDKKNNAIGIVFAKNIAPELYRMNYSEKYGATCKIKSFLLNNELDAKSIAGKYAYNKVNAASVGLDDGEMYIVSLNENNSSTAPGGDEV